MPLGWIEIKSRALAFSKEWEHETSEDAEAKSFWDDFFKVFGANRRRLSNYEAPVKKLGEKQGFIDLFWKGELLIEHKSRGKDLDKAYQQARDYFPGLKDDELPKRILVSDFARFRMYDMDEGGDTYHEFELKDFHKNVKLFGFIAGYQTHKIQEQDPVNIKAAERMGNLHDQMKAIGYEGHALELYLVRLLFCLFAEDTGIFQRQQFQEYVEQRTGEDGTDLAHHINTLFQVLNTPEGKRFKNLDEQLAAFPYVNGKLFEEMLSTASFDTAMRQSLLDCCALDWSRISPAIFGSLFQSIMDKKARRNLGAHYTSEKNILKLIKPLFLDALWEEFEQIKILKQVNVKQGRLFEFHIKLRALTFLDPACGCGNFLVIAYRELRLLELELLREFYKDAQEAGQTDDVEQIVMLDVDQFYGIEIEEFPAQIAQVALWLMDHQMNLLISEYFGRYFARIPLRASSTIKCGNALQLDWSNVIAADKLSYIMGNPPFLGYAYQSNEQKADLNLVFSGIESAGILDFVAAWYVKAARMIKDTHIRCAFVSTNSITQGEQVAVLWGWMLANGVYIHFAHRTFQWSNEAKGNAGVHCVIVGFAAFDVDKKWLYEYENIKSDAHLIQAKNINPYLADAPTALIQKRKYPISMNAPEMTRGSQPTDGGNLLLSQEEKDQFIKIEPLAEQWIKPFSMGDEFINGISRYCLWLKECPPQELKKLPTILKRLEAVKNMRSSSTKASTREWANNPKCFTEDRQPNTNYLAVPRVSSERRMYVPIGFMSPDHIAGDKLQTVANATLFHFGVITSSMHMAWMRSVCGRLESRYSYSNTIVYNNFPWPENPIDKQKQAIERAAQSVLDSRLTFPDSSLADLYDPLTMPPILQKAHQVLDKAVDAAYGKTTFKTEAERVAFLFELYQKYTSLLPVEKPKKARKKVG